MAIGKVKWYSREKGYGFITIEDGADIFVHYTQINMEGFKFLLENQSVEIEIAEGEKGPQANNVKIIVE